ncbi:hypothetical protein B0A55_02175 [Friedmanniomyces simplex]|uniref:Rhodopsin domain-containing protein n=1 Tax=Friedmanniomyces simplex TaxID=329884 RepID=A0A4U0Y272_9PEZI|nr:hypothetical protein B0A55_02175 [Friedmanniomyces simplex]
MFQFSYLYSSERPGPGPCSLRGTGVEPMPAFDLSRPAAFLAITASTAIVWTSFTLSIRIFLRWKINGPFGFDDAACGAATLLGILYSSLMLAQLPFGLGRHTDDLSAATIQRARLLTWISTMVLTLGLTCALLSMCFLMVRICGIARKAWVAYGIAVTACVLAVVSICLTAFQCELPTPWDISRPEFCLDLWALYASTTTIMIALELAIVIAAIVLVRSLQMPLCLKAQVIALFALRLLIIAPNTTRLRYLHIALFSADWSYARVPLQIVNQITLHLSIILATIPCAKPFLTVFESGGLHLPAEAAPTELPELNRPPVDDHSNTITSVRHDPADAETAARDRSLGAPKSESSDLRILRTDSVVVAYDDAENLLHQRKSVEGPEINNWRLPEL